MGNGRCRKRRPSWLLVLLLIVLVFLLICFVVRCTRARTALTEDAATTEVFAGEWEYVPPEEEPSQGWSYDWEDVEVIVVEVDETREDAEATPPTGANWALPAAALAVLAVGLTGVAVFGRKQGAAE